MKLVAISDIHNRYHKLEIPECDVLIVAGDWTSQGRIDEVQEFAKWLNEQNSGHIVLVPGNHELYFEKVYPDSRNWILDHCPAANILIHDSIDIEGIKIFGSAWTPYFCNCAYNGARTPTEITMYGNRPLMKDLWSQIPENTNILITHGPPHNILDYAPICGNVGCTDLMDRVLKLPNLKTHIFGHIHYSYGYKRFNGVDFYNVANCNEAYSPSNPITVIEYD